MSKIKISIENKENKILLQNEGENEISLFYEEEYQEGDKIVFEMEEVMTFYYASPDDALMESLIFITDNRIEYVVPFGEKRISLSNKVFRGNKHYIHIRKAEEFEYSCYHDLACNPMAQHQFAGYYPYAYANVETRGESVFAARNAIDGITANESHGEWPYESWGINRDDNAKFTLNFGKKVCIDRIVLYTRADFPHDNWWKEVTVSFDNEKEFTYHLEKSVAPHVIKIEEIVTETLTLRKLIKADDPSPFPALSQIKVFGKYK